MEHIPFYKTFTLEDYFQKEIHRQKEFAQMKDAYSLRIRQLLRLVERKMDELEFEGSRLYDEIPDQKMLEMEVMKLYETLPEDEWLKDLIQVLFYQELYCRRCRR